MSTDHPDAFYFKHRGIRVKARLQKPEELINEASLHFMCRESPITYEQALKEPLTKYRWLPSLCVGETVGEHMVHGRIYIEVLSPHFIKESVKGPNPFYNEPVAASR